VVEPLEPLVGGRRRPELGLGRPSELGGRLLAELPEALRRELETGPRRGIGERKDAHRESDHHRVDARLEKPDPRDCSQHEVHEPDPEAQHVQDEHDGVGDDRDQERTRMDRRRVDRRDDEQRDDVVHDDDGEHERA